MAKCIKSVAFSPPQIKTLLMFRKAVRKFLNLVENFEIEKSTPNEVLKMVVILREEVIQIRNKSIAFLDFSNDWIKELDRHKFEEIKDIDKVKIDTNKNETDASIRKKLEKISGSKLLKSDFYRQMMFNLAEIYADYYQMEKVLSDMLRQKKSIHPDLLYTYLAGDFSLLEFHTLNHVDDLVSFDDELIYVKGLMSSISDFLENVRL